MVGCFSSTRGSRRCNEIRTKIKASSHQKDTPEASIEGLGVKGLGVKVQGLRVSGFRV